MIVAGGGISQDGQCWISCRPGFSLRVRGSRCCSGIFYMETDVLEVTESSGGRGARHLDSGKVLRTLEGHQGWVRAVALLGDGRRALSASEDNTLKLWDLNTGELLRTLEGHWDSVVAVTLLGDGRRALSASEDNTLKLWDLDTGELLATFTADAAVTTIAIMQDHRFVAGSADGRLHILRLVESENQGDQLFRGFAHHSRKSCF
jgi:WD40 repeat protein